MRPSPLIALAQLRSRSGVIPQSITEIGSLIASVGIVPMAGGGVHCFRRSSSSRRRATIGGQWWGPRAGPPCAQVRHELLERLADLVARELEDVLGVGEEAVRREQRAEFADLVEEARLEPVLAEELVLLDVGEDCSRQPEQLVEGPRACSSSRAPYSSARRLRSAASCSVGRSVSRPSASASMCPRIAEKGIERVVEPGAVVVVQAVSGAHVEPGVLHRLERLQPAAPRLAAAELLDRSRPASARSRSRVDAGLARQPRQVAQLGVGPNSGTSMPETIWAMCWSGISGRRALAEVGEREVRAVAEQQELEVVLPHLLVHPQRPVVGVEHADEPGVAVLEGDGVVLVGVERRHLERVDLGDQRRIFSRQLP